MWRGSRCWKVLGQVGCVVKRFGGGGRYLYALGKVAGGYLRRGAESLHGGAPCWVWVWVWREGEDSGSLLYVHLTSLAFWRDDMIPLCDWLGMLVESLLFYGYSIASLREWVT